MNWNSEEVYSPGEMGLGVGAGGAGCGLLHHRYMYVHRDQRSLEPQVQLNSGSACLVDRKPFPRSLGKECHQQSCSPARAEPSLPSFRLLGVSPLDLTNDLSGLKV